MKILSKILAVMVPVAVTFEIHSGGENQKIRFQAEQEKSKAPSSSKASGESDSEVFERKYGYGPGQ